MDGLKHRYERRMARAVDKLAEKVDVTFETNPFRSLKKRMVIACSARTGSHLLCQHLLTHGAVAMECFGPTEIGDACRDQGLAGLEAYCHHHLEKNAPRGIFGVKGWSDILAPLVLAGEIPAHIDEWQFVHLTRADTLKQAISFVIAAQTLSWKSFRAPVKTLRDDDFDAEKIRRAVAGFTSRNKEWEETFELFGIEPMRITYENLAADPEGVSAAVAGYLGLHGPPIQNKRFMTPPLEVQSTDLNARWEERYLALAG